MIRVYKIPVNEPISQPFCLPLPPDTNPPTNSVIKVIAVVTIPSEDSCVDVNLKMTEKIKLLIISSKKIAITPNKTALPKLLDSSILTLSPQQK